MIAKKDIETILKINGVSPTAADEEIRSVLMSAKYDNDEINTAIMVLRENSSTHVTRVSSLHKIFTSDSSLKPSEISSLLGINVDIEELKFRRSRSQGRDLTKIQMLIIVTITIILALSGTFFAMYYNKVGIFHASASTFTR